MNLKEAFRYSNHLNDSISSIVNYLSRTPNIATTTSEHQRSKADPAAEDITTTNESERQLSIPVDKLVGFMLSLVEEKQSLSEAITRAKNSCPFDIDAAVAANKSRREAAFTMRRMLSVKERVRETTGTSFRLNAEGNQSPYTYTIVETTKPDFDRASLRTDLRSIEDASDNVSSNIEEALVTAQVDIQPRYRSGDTLEEMIEVYLAITDGAPAAA